MLPTSSISPRGVIFNAYIKEALHSHKDYSQRMLTLSFCRKKVHHLSNEEMKQQRKELFQAINGDASFPLKPWPKKMMIFYNKLPGDTDTLLASQTWVLEKAQKQAWQIDFLVNNLDNKHHVWFYFDVDYWKMLFLNSLPKVRWFKYQTVTELTMAKPLQKNKQKQKTPLLQGKISTFTSHHIHKGHDQH